MKSSNTFFGHMTSFDKNQKAEFMNMIQYALLVLIPIILVNKGLGELFSNSVDDKTSIELSLEVIAELFILLTGIYFVHRIVSYIPTYSETPYSSFNFIGITLVLMVIIFSFQTNISAKTQNVLDNLYHHITGRMLTPTPTNTTSNQKNIQINESIQIQPPPEYLNKQAVQTINPMSPESVSNVVLGNQIQMNQQQQQPQQSPNFDTIHEPMAANMFFK